MDISENNHIHLGKKVLFFLGNGVFKQPLF